MVKRILIADDEPALLDLLELVLVEQNFEVLTARSGDEVVRIAQETGPDLIMVDLMMTGVDGFEAIRQLRNDTRTAHIPTLILTARSTPNDVVIGFETGADDYITKPFNVPELLARIKGHLRRAAQRAVTNPLTGLPGNVLLSEEIKRRLKRDESFALCHVDLNNFKAFNDTYGFARGDRMIKLVAEILVNACQKYGDDQGFVGHIGGDDFVIITSTDDVDAICIAALEDFDRQAQTLYDPSDLERGYLYGIDRQGNAQQFPIISISIGVATNQQHTFTDVEEMGRVAAMMKRYAKQQPNSYYAVDARASSLPVVEERRGNRIPVVALLSPHNDIRLFVSQTLLAEGYRLLEAINIPQANALISHTPDLALLIIDAQLGELLPAFIHRLNTVWPQLTPLVLAHTAEEAELARTLSVKLLRLPLDRDQLLECVASLSAQRQE